MNVRPWKPPPKAIDPRAAGVRTGNLDAVLDRLRAGRDEDRLFRRRPRRQVDQLLGQRDRRFVGRDHQAGMTERIELLRYRGLHLRVQVTGVEHGNAGGEVDVSLSIHVPHLRVARALDVDGKLVAQSARECSVTTLLQVMVARHDFSGKLPVRMKPLSLDDGGLPACRDNRRTARRRRGASARVRPSLPGNRASSRSRSGDPGTRTRRPARRLSAPRCRR